MSINTIATSKQIIRAPQKSKASFTFIKIFVFLFVLILPVLTLAQETSGNLYRNEENLFSITFPEGWNIEKGNSSNVVIKSTSENGNGLESINILVKDLPEELWNSDITEIMQAEDLLTGTNAKILDSGISYMDNQKSLRVKSELSYTAMGTTVYGVQMQIANIHSNKMFVVTAGAGASTQSKANENYILTEPILYESLSSFQFEDWDTQNVAITNNDSTNTASQNTDSDNIFTVLAISFFLTWGIGLSVPLIIRFAIVKKPIKKNTSITIVIILWLINLFIFDTLGSESKTHAALFLVAIVSYYILHKGFAEEKKKKIS